MPDRTIVDLIDEVHAEVTDVALRTKLETLINSSCRRYVLKDKMAEVVCQLIKEVGFLRRELDVARYRPENIGSMLHHRGVDNEARS
jgi:hypothetical protein